MSATAKRVLLGSLEVDSVSCRQAVDRVMDQVAEKAQSVPFRISCPNASLVAEADIDRGFARIIRASELVVADGKPLLWAARFLGTPLVEQIRGVDLMEQICAAGSRVQMTFYILGGLPDAAEIAGSRLLQRYPGLQLAGFDCPAFGFEQNTEQNRFVCERIISASPDFLIVALGSPKQEWWIDANFRDLPVAAILGVGAAIDTYAGLRPRPPRWMRSSGLEWLGRLIQEPRRLWRRYLFGNSRFVWVIVRQWLHRTRN